jgi:HlyD family secretion protein
VVTYNTTIAFDNLDLRLFPGMTAYVSIPVATANDVVKIPNGALRFKPDLSDSDRNKLYAKYGIVDNAGATPAARMAATATPAPAGNQGATPAPAAAAPATGAAGTAAAGGAGQGGGGGNRGGQGNGNGSGGGGRRAGAASQREDTGIVWKLLPDKSLEPVQVGLGVTDFTFTAMTKGNLNPSDDLVIGQSAGKTTAAQQARSPLGGPGGGGAPGVPRRF